MQAETNPATYSISVLFNNGIRAFGIMQNSWSWKSSANRERKFRIRIWSKNWFNRELMLVRRDGVSARIVKWRRRFLSRKALLHVVFNSVEVRVGSFCR